MDRKLITIAEISFALIFIIIMAMLIGNILGFGENTNKRLETMRTTIEESEIATYNGGIVSGDTVISTINKLTETNNIKMSYAVYDGSSWEYYGLQKIGDNTGSNKLFDSNNTESADLGYVDGGDYVKYPLSRQPGDSGYISPVKEYTSEILFNSNGVLVGIAFRMD